MENIRLCMVDIDGTFIDHTMKCPELNQKAVIEMRKQGIRFGIASGRPVGIIPRLFKDWNLEGQVDYVVGSNGAEIYDCVHDTMKEQFYLSSELIRFIEQELKEFQVSVCVYEGTTLVANKITKELIERSAAIQLDYRIENYQEYISKSYPKILLMGSSQEHQKVFEFCRKQGYTDFKLASSGAILTEVTDPHLSKISGIYEVCKELGITKDNVLCFGDERNDIEMLSEFHGVCVSNAIDEVKQVCQYETTSCDEGGVGQFIFDHILK